MGCHMINLQTRIITRNEYLVGITI